MDSPQAKPRRRGFMLGAMTAAGAATAVATLPRVQPEAPAPVAQPQPAPERGGGYHHLSEHVQRYYKTTRL